MRASHASLHDAHFGLWVTDPGVTTGQSVVTDRVSALLATEGLSRFILVPGMGVHSLWVWLHASGRLVSQALRGRLRTLYVVCSRSNGGFVRDLPAYLARCAGVRVVIHVHGSDIVDLLQRRGIGAVARWALGSCTLIVPSAHLVNPLMRLGISDCKVCENFVEEPPTPSKHNVKLVGAPYVVLWNSNVMASKGFFAVAEAVALLNSKGFAVRMVALGAPLADEVMSAVDCAALLAKFQLYPWMEYRGLLDRADAWKALLNCDIVCLPSYYVSECQPLALLEAMCMNKPLLVADTPALRATVQDYPCEVVTQTDVMSIANALQRCQYADTPSYEAQLQLAGDVARHRFSTQRFDCQLRRLLGIDLTLNALNNN